MIIFNVVQLKMRSTDQIRRNDERDEVEADAGDLDEAGEVYHGAKVFGQPLEADGGRPDDEGQERKLRQRDLEGVASVCHMPENLSLVVLEEAAEEEVDDLFQNLKDWDLNPCLRNIPM